MRHLALTSLILLALSSTALAGDPVKLLTLGQPTDAAADPVLLQEMPKAAPAADLAKTKPTATDNTTKAVAPPAKGPDEVELAALYYYASQKQDARVEAETQRLKYKYPGFTLPKDLYQPQDTRGQDETALWALYDKGDVAAIQAEIARRQAEIAGWQPSADFSAKLARKSMRISIETATKAKDWPTVIAAAATLDPATETEVDLLWDLIDAQSAAGATEAMAATYRGILFRDAGHALPKPVIITTIQKATRDFPAAEVRAVMAHFATDPVISAGLSTVSLDLFRKAIADFNADEAATAPLDKAEIARLASAVGKDGKAADFSLLGWYFLKIKEPAEAGAWFRRALDVEASIEHAKGLYLSLVKQQRQQEAYDLALANRDALAADPVFLMNALAERFAKPETGAIDAEAVKAYSSTILATRSGDHAEILAWYAYNSGQFLAARAWFTKAFDWEPKEPRLKGLALAAAQLGDRDGLVALYRTYGNRFPAIWDDIHLAKGTSKKTRQKDTRKGFIDRMQVGAVNRDVVTDDQPVERPVARTKTAANGTYLGHFQAKRFGQCVSALMTAESRGALSADQSLVKGWCLMGLSRTAEAKASFSAALAGNAKTRADAAYGLSLVLLRGKLTDDAESVIALYPLAASRDSEVRSEIYWQKARSSFDHKQYQRTLDALNARLAVTPEPANLTQLRAWAHFNLGHVAEARQIFERLAGHLDDAGVRRGLAATSGIESNIK